MGYENLVFEGGGVRGVAYAGACRALEERQVLKDIKKVAGTSAGSMVAMGLALGGCSKDIEELTEYNMSNFLKGCCLPNLVRLFRGYGWYNGKRLANFLKDTIKKLVPEHGSNITFRKLHSLTEKGAHGVHCPLRELYVTGVNLTKQRREVFCFENTPDMPIWLAVRISASIPVFFSTIKWNGDIYADGGIVYNYPADIFDRKNTLGIRVDDQDELTSWEYGVPRSVVLPPVKIKGLGSYASAYISFVQGTANKLFLSSDDWKFTIHINGLGVSFTDFELSEETKKALKNSGADAVERFFKWRESTT